MVKVENMFSTNGNRVANQFVIFSDRKRVFQSYDSICCVVDENGVTLGRDWDFSITTLKYLYLFLKEYTNVFDKLPKGSSKKDSIQKAIDYGVINYDYNLM